MPKWANTWKTGQTHLFAPLGQVGRSPPGPRRDGSRAQESCRIPALGRASCQACHVMESLPCRGPRPDLQNAHPRGCSTRFLEPDLHNLSGGDFRAPSLGLLIGLWLLPQHADLPPALGQSHHLPAPRTQALTLAKVLGEVVNVS